MNFLRKWKFTFQFCDNFFSKFLSKLQSSSAAENFMELFPRKKNVPKVFPQTSVERFYTFANKIQ